LIAGRLAAGRVADRQGMQISSWLEFRLPKFWKTCRNNVGTMSEV
jgi:hypothetical protein